jgi:hypothetical protein
MLNLDKLHSHFEGYITGVGSGKTTAVIYQLIGFMEVGFDGDIVVLTKHQIDIKEFVYQFKNILKNRYLEKNEYFNLSKYFDKNIHFYTYIDYLDFKMHGLGKHLVVFDFRDATSVTHTLEEFKKAQDIIVTASIAEGVKQAFDMSPDIEINYE